MCGLTLMITLVLGMSQLPEARPSPTDSKPDEPIVPDLRKTPEDLFDPKAHPEAVARGRAEAEKELEAGKAKIWGYGLSIDSLDRETGLYYSSFGCVIDNEIIGRVKGHNDRIAESIREHGLPKYSLKPWEKELYDLPVYFETRRKVEVPSRLTIGGPEARSPDGKYVVKLVKRSHQIPVLTPPTPNDVVAPVRADREKFQTVESNFLVVDNQEGENDRIFYFLDDPEPELVWGPKSSWFAVLKGKRRDHTIWMAIDLRSKRNIREEWDKKEFRGPIPPPPKLEGMK